MALRAAVSLPDGLVGRRIATIATAVYAAPACLDGQAEESAPRCVDWVGPDDSLCHLGSARWMAREVTPERVVLRANILAGLQVAVAAGLGLAPLPCFLGDADPGLVRVMATVPEMEAGLWLLTRPDLRRAARVRVMLDALAKHLSGARRGFAGEGRRPFQAAAASPAAPVSRARRAS